MPENFFLTTAGNIFFKFESDINRELQSSNRINSRTLRKTTASLRDQLTPTKNNLVGKQMCHEDPTADAVYKVSTIGAIKAKDMAVKQAHFVGMIDSNILPNIPKLFDTSFGAKFPTRQVVEDKVFEALDIVDDDVSLDDAIMRKIEVKWLDANAPSVVQHFVLDKSSYSKQALSDLLKKSKLWKKYPGRRRKILSAIEGQLKVSNEPSTSSCSANTKKEVRHRQQNKVHVNFVNSLCSLSFFYFLATVTKRFL